MTLTTEVILASATLCFGILNVLQFVINMAFIFKNRRSQNKFFVKLTMDILKAKKEGDFGALEELLGAEKPQPALEEPPQKENDAVFTGSLNGAAISVDFTKYAPPSGTAEQRKPLRSSNFL